MDKKHFQKYFSTKFLMELQGTFMAFFWNYLNYLSEFLARGVFNGLRLLINPNLFRGKELNQRSLGKKL